MTESDIPAGEIRPYISLVLAKIRTDSASPATIVDRIIEALEKFLELGSNQRRLVGKTIDRFDDGVNRAFIHYEEKRKPSWLKPRSTLEIQDTLNHLAIVCRVDSHLAFFASDPALRTSLAKFLSTGKGGVGALEELTRIEVKTLTDAFVGGKARTLWLSGIHRQTAVKADNKVLSGSELQLALNPLDDQSYHFTAARTTPKLPGITKVVGLAPKRANVWVGMTKEWEEFRDVVKAILTAIQEAEENPKEGVALPILAAPVTDTKDIANAFDVSLIPPELLADDPAIDPEVLQEAQNWAYRAKFEVVECDGANVKVRGWLDEQLLGTITIGVSLNNPDQVNISLHGEMAQDAIEADFESMVRAMGNPGWLKIRYESGETLSDGSLYRQQYLDFPFTNWLFMDLGNTDLGKEKPGEIRSQADSHGNPKKVTVYRPDLIGEQDSLFCWIVKYWFGTNPLGSKQGWLACDDGANEIADFIHLDLGTSPPTINLIHAKAAKGAAEISVSDFEVVCGQAVKNLRFLDQAILVNAEPFSDIGSQSTTKPVWEGSGKLGKREDMKKALVDLNGNYQRRVFVFQPRVTKSMLEKAKATIAKMESTSKQVKAKYPEGNRLRQLNNLLLATEAACRDLNAEFFVLSSDQ